MDKNNKVTKKDIIEGIGFIVMIVGIIALIMSLHTLQQINKECKITQRLLPA